MDSLLPLQFDRPFCVLPRPAVKFNTARCAGKTKGDNYFLSYPVAILEIDLWRAFLGTIEKGNQLVYIYRSGAKNVKLVFFFIVSKAHITCLGYLGKSPEGLLIKSSFFSIQKQFVFC